MKQSTNFRFPYNGALVPLLQNVAFIKADIDAIKDEYLKWREEYNSSGLSFQVEACRGSLDANARALLPFNDDRKVLLMPTKSDWIAYTDNHFPAITDKAIV